MDFFDQLLKLERVHYLICRKATGTPKYLSKKLNISERQVYRLISSLKLMGFPVAYCKQKRTYHYTDTVKLFFEVKIGEDQILKIKGGVKNNITFLSNCQKVAVKSGNFGLTTLLRDNPEPCY